MEESVLQVKAGNVWEGGKQGTGVPWTSFTSLRGLWEGDWRVQVFSKQWILQGRKLALWRVLGRAKREWSCMTGTKLGFWNDLWWCVPWVRGKSRGKQQTWSVKDAFSVKSAIAIVNLLIVSSFSPVVSQVMRESWPASSFHLCPVCCTAVPTQGCWPSGSDPPVLLFQMVCSISARRWWRNPQNNSACLNLCGVWKQIKDLYSCTGNYQS